MNQRKVNVVVYIGKSLSEQNRDQIEGFIRQQDGVYGTRSNDRTRHLVLVDYDPKVVSATGILQGIHRQGVDARLIGL
ncbi:MAG: hypothetical protein AMJ53_17575 [Gammaproteobacteria bacterium SG8_11]|nr:MAG: hypothetical protein AMJ53_17575 [Gammaproteobacteria bacterium SG8_11]